MPCQDLEILRAPAEARPAVLEGGWLGGEGGGLAAIDPCSVLERSGEALAELPLWLRLHGRQFPRGAAVGFLTYELARWFEKLPLTPDPALPDFSFAYYPRLEIIPASTSTYRDGGKPPHGEFVTGFDRERFHAGVSRIREYVAAGDIYQANLTQQCRIRLNGTPPEAIYQRLSPGQAPFRGFLKHPRCAIVSASPERFFRVHSGRILASPIKGTIRRGEEPQLDKQRAAALLASEKDRAENLMIVDLLRNDLGRICLYDSIRANLWQIETLPQLLHLVSHVEGRLRPGTGALEILRALFPCGSITGAPKIRAMEILSEIEAAPRGVSMGAIGIIRGAPEDAGFEMDFNVAIRTMTIQNDVATFNVGGGIVYDSEPQAEFEEMLLKARPLLDALGLETRGARPVPERVTLRR
ncbi:MAG: anthranilate synthase component I family protein [Acidobacteriia bacterium]|nr:anthranilate synthase component I family protein [Terriglobia bacterium]